MSDTVAESIMFTKENSRILRKHYTVLTGSKYVPHLPSIYEDSIEDYIGEDVDEDQQYCDNDTLITCILLIILYFVFHPIYQQKTWEMGSR